MKIQYFVHVHLNCLNLMTIHNLFPLHLQHHHYLILKVEIDTLHNKYNITAYKNLKIHSVKLCQKIGKFKVSIYQIYNLSHPFL